MKNKNNNLSVVLYSAGIIGWINILYNPTLIALIFALLCGFLAEFFNLIINE